MRVGVLVLAFFVNTNGIQYMFFLDKFNGHCAGLNRPKATFENVQIRYSRTRDLIVNFDVIVRKAFDEPLQAIWNIERCSSREALDTCIQFATLKTKNFCNLLEGADKPWAPFLTCIKPKYACPIKKITYFGRNCTLNSTNFFIPIVGSYWKLKSEVRDLRDNSLVVCLYFEGGAFARH